MHLKEHKLFKEVSFGLFTEFRSAFQINMSHRRKKLPLFQTIRNDAWFLMTYTLYISTCKTKA